MGKNHLSEQEILDYFSSWDLSEPARTYIPGHVNRYIFNLRMLKDIIKKIDTKHLEILDIGPHLQTEIIYLSFDNITINTLGYENLMLYKKEHVNEHLEFDLNDAQEKKNWPEFKKHDIVIMAEVIEHLHTSPELILGCVRNFIKEDGYLIVQTPNAVSFDKRIKLMMGKNPYHLISKSVKTPNHFREYTSDELTEIGKAAGLRVEKIYYLNYEKDGELLKNFLKKIGGFRENFRQG